MYGDGPEAGSVATYLNWQEWEPDNWDNMEHCVRVTEGIYYDNNCDRSIWFVVEFECPVGTIIDDQGTACIGTREFSGVIRLV